MVGLGVDARSPVALLPDEPTRLNRRMGQSPTSTGRNRALLWPLGQMDLLLRRLSGTEDQIPSTTGHR